MPERPPRLGDSIPNFDRIVQAIRRGQCIPFLGAGVSSQYQEWRNGSAVVAGCPTGGELKETLEKALHERPYPSPELQHITLNDLPSLAEFYMYFDNGQRGEIEEKTRQAIARAACPRPIHWALAGIPSIRCVFTTNYDELLESAAAAISPARKMVGPYVYNQCLDEQEKPTLPLDLISNRPFRSENHEPGSYPLILYKMHGCVQHPGSMLITTNDYVRYMANWRDERLGMPKVFRDLFVKNTFLYLGYGLGDWNFRVIWEALIGALPSGRFSIQSYAVKKTVTPFERSLFERRGIDLIQCDLTLFARALAEEFGVDIPLPPTDPANAVNQEGGA